MKKIFFTILLLSFLPACAQSTQEPAFNGFFQEVVEKIQNKPDYTPIPMNTEQQSDRFIKLYSELYNGKISKTKFVAAMKADYPNKDYEPSIVWLSKQVDNY